MVDQTDDNQEAYDILVQSLGLRINDVIAAFPPQHESEKKFEILKQQLKKLIISFLSFYFEDIPDKYKSSKTQKKRNDR